MSSETRLRSKKFRHMSHDSKSGQDRKHFNGKHNVLEGPGASKVDGDAHGIAWEDFDVGGGAAAADVTVNEGGEADETFDDPDRDDGFQVDHLLGSIQMDPKSGHG